MKNEKWKQIQGFEGCYMVSSLGRVKSLERKVKSKNNSCRTEPEKILKQGENDLGYRTCVLYKNNKKKYVSIHALVWDHFGDKERDGFKLQVDHIDNNPSNNKIKNLQLLTNRENTSKGFLQHKKSSLYTGVSRIPAGWSSAIRIKNKKVFLGTYNDEILAKNAYEDALSELLKTGTISKYTPGIRVKSSNYPGVCFRKSTGKWRATVYKNYKTKEIGEFETEQLAYLARTDFLKEVTW